MREFDLLQQVFEHNADLPRAVTIPPGDDMGAITLGDRQLLMTVDQVADGVHVNCASTPINRVGRKSIVRSLSDVAAMAATPVGALVAVSLPRNFGAERAMELFEAIRSTGANYNCPLVGGDIAIWDQPLIVSVTVFAEPGGIAPVLRTGARTGDAIYVTGSLGASFSSGHHMDFEPRIALARKLASNPDTRPHCMIDLSDGLARDLGHLCRGALIEAAALPIRDGANSWQEAVGDGEDYELLFTAPVDSMPNELSGVLISCIGIVTDTGHLKIRLPDGSNEDLSALGWEHRG